MPSGGSMITGTVRLDLSADDEAEDRRAIGTLYGVPAGVRVVVEVDSRNIVHPWTADHLRVYAETLHIDVQGSPAAVKAWVDALHFREAWSA